MSVLSCVCICSGFKKNVNNILINTLAQDKLTTSLTSFKNSFCSIEKLLKREREREWWRESCLTLNNSTSLTVNLGNVGLNIKCYSLTSAHMNEHLPVNAQAYTWALHAGCRETLWMWCVVGVDISVVMKGAAVGFNWQLGWQPLRSCLLKLSLRPFFIFMTGVKLPLSLLFMENVFVFFCFQHHWKQLLFKQRPAGFFFFL